MKANNIITKENIRKAIIFINFQLALLITLPARYIYFYIRKQMAKKESHKKWASVYYNSLNAH